MMDKPDDIPQDVWDAADAALPPLDGTRYASAHVLVARAILAERERCARVVDNERIDDPLDYSDEAYNLALSHSIDAIQSGSGT